MKINASIRVNRPQPGGKVFEPFASVVGTHEDGKRSVEFTVNGDKDTIDRVEAVASEFRAKGYSPVLSVVGGTVSETPEMVTDAGLRRPATWAGKPIHRITGEITFTVVGKELLPTAKPAATLLADATAILDA
jgi:hypothetical protein